MFKFITQRSLGFNILAGIILALVIFSVFILSLNWLTHHGNSKTVPAVVGKTFGEASKLLDKMGFDVEIQDSVYIDSLPPLAVIKQVPDADAVVKVNRKVYLTINRSVPPFVEMPNLVGYSNRYAEIVLKNMGLRIGDIQYKSDFAKNSVLQQLYDGSEIRPGTKLKMGSSITLILGNGLGEQEFAVPFLVGMRFYDAKTMLESNGLAIGAIIAPNVADTMNAYIYRQSPERYDFEKNIQRIRPGQMIDVWLQSDKPSMDTTNEFLPQ